MLPVEVKKLKVAELRALLKQRGLEAKGLKGELVIRLISAIEAGQEPIKSAEEVGNVREEAIPETPEHRPDSPLTLYDESTTSKKVYNHQSTQTEPLPLCSCTAPKTSDGRSHPQPADPLPEQPVTLTTSAKWEKKRVSGCSSPSKAGKPSDQDQLCQTDKSKTVDTHPDDGRAQKRPSQERGRDYYEFKEEIHYKRVKTAPVSAELGERSEIDLDNVLLDAYNCDLHFEVALDGSSGQPLLWEKFPLIWSGCRMSHGFYYGKVGFEAKFVKRLSAARSEKNFDPDMHVLRVGWSVDNTSLQLGEVEMSFGFDGRGKRVTGGNEEDFGEPFSEGDVIGCYAFISETGEATLSFQKNGCSLGVAFQLNASVLGGQALYPHVLCKNCSVSVNLHPHAPWHPFPAEFCTLSILPPGQRTRAPLPAASKSECEVLMMVGLPGSGKTHWAQAHILQNPKKRYTIISTNSILNCMRKPAAHDQRELMLQQATQCISHLITIAANKRRNYILDQANIYPSAQRHKMLCFHGYQRKAVVVFPPDEVWKSRLTLWEEEECMALQDTSLLKAKASFVLPEEGGHLEQVMFVELSSDEALKLLTQYKEEARSCLPIPPKRGKRRQKHSAHHCGRSGRPFGFHNHNTFQKAWAPSAYGCRSDPQRYRKYYRPCSGQWSFFEQNQSSSCAQYGWGAPDVCTEKSGLH